MGLDKRMKKRIQQIDKNLDAIVKNPYEKKEIIDEGERKVQDLKDLFPLAFRSLSAQGLRLS